MANMCSWCGKKIPFIDGDFDWVEINSKGHYICKECRSKINAYKRGDALMTDIITENTSKDLLNYYQKADNEELKEKREKAHTKMEARKIDPLYDDIHQIATDLRFIKNYLVICIIIGAILGLISIVSLF